MHWQVREFLQAAKGEHLEAFYTVALTLGLRQGEVLGVALARCRFGRRPITRAPCAPTGTGQAPIGRTENLTQPAEIDHAPERGDGTPRAPEAQTRSTARRRSPEAGTGLRVHHDHRNAAGCDPCRALIPRDS